MLLPASRYTAVGTFPDCFRAGADPHCTAAELDANLHRHKQLTGSLPAFAITAAFSFDPRGPYAFPFHLLDVMDERGVVPWVILWPYPVDTVEVEDGVLKYVNRGDYDEALVRSASDLYAWSYGGKRPVMLQWGTELTLDSYPWSAAQNGGWEMTGSVDGQPWPEGPARYVHSARRVHAIFREAGCNVTWNWHVLAEFSGRPLNEPQWYWPGPEFTDWVGVGVYRDRVGGIYSTFESGFTESLRQLEAVPGSQDKWFYLEAMCQEKEGDPSFKAQFWDDCFTLPYSGRWPWAASRLKANAAWDAHTALVPADTAPGAGPPVKFSLTTGREVLVPAEMGIDSHLRSLEAFRAGCGQEWCSNQLRRA